jgi:membrane protein DedA with SNARE-associated domain
MNFEYLLTQYGYLAVFLGSIFEGETILTLAGFFVHKGYLHFLPSILCASCGGMLGDQLCFLLGRYYGSGLVRYFPKLTPMIEKTNKLLDKHSSIIIIVVRFMYGVRIAGPIAIGMSKIPFIRFALFNTFGALLWASVILSIGVLFGESVHWMLAKYQQYARIMLVIVIILALIALVIALYKKKYHHQQKK